MRAPGGLTSAGSGTPAVPATAAFDRLLAMIAAHTGIDGRASRTKALRALYAERLVTRGVTDPMRYLDTLLDDADEWQRYMAVVTIGETHFFRDRARWEALERHVLPSLLERAGGRPLQLWSAGCATGEEVYSLAALVDRAGVPARIAGTDLNRRAIAFAREGIYTDYALRGMSDAERDTLLEAAGPGKWRVRDRYRRHVGFESDNLIAWAEAARVMSEFDLILCQKVVIYFSEATTQRLVGAMSAALRPGGYLVMGYSEVMAPPPGLTVAAIGDTFCFRKPLAEAGESRPRGHATARPAIPQAPRTDPLPAAWELVVHEEFGRAEALLRGHAKGGEAACLLAWIHYRRRQLTAARRQLAAHQADAARCPEPHFIGGMIDQAMNDCPAALTAFKRALFLDPSFAVAHYHLAELQWAQGWHGPARLSWRNAEVAAERDAQRIYRFFGGFDVAAFRQACVARSGA